MFLDLGTQYCKDALSIFYHADIFTLYSKLLGELLNATALQIYILPVSSCFHISLVLLSSISTNEPLSRPLVFYSSNCYGSIRLDCDFTAWG